MSDHEKLSEISMKLDGIVIQVEKTHAALFGIDGQGGLHRWVQDHERRITDLQQHKNKLVGVMVVLTGIFGIIGAKIMSLISTK